MDGSDSDHWPGVEWRLRSNAKNGMAVIIEVVLLLAGRETKMRDALGFAGFSPHGFALVKAVLKPAQPRAMSVNAQGVA